VGKEIPVGDSVDFRFAREADIAIERVVIAKKE
jgi:hypothetical protein